MKLRPLSRLLLVLTLAAVSLPAAAAQSINKQALQQQLEHKVFLLRGRYACPRPESCTLVFNQQGQLQNKAKIAPFSLSAIYVNSVKVGRQTLQIHAHPVTLLRLSKASPPKLSALLLKQQKLTIRIGITPATPSGVQKALWTIFAGNAQQVLNAEPSQQRKADFETLPLLTSVSEAQANLDQTTVGWPPTPVDLKGPKDGVTAPRAIYMPPALLTQHSRGGSKCKLQFVINARGFPQNIRVVHCSSGELTQPTITAVSQFRYHPATQNGKPVPVRTWIKLVVLP